MVIPKISNQGKQIKFIIQRKQRQAQYFSEDLGNGVILEMVAIPGGTFLMGSPETEEGHRDNESPQHRVTVQPFFIGKYPVNTRLLRRNGNQSRIYLKLIKNSTLTLLDSKESTDL